MPSPPSSVWLPSSNLLLIRREAALFGEEILSERMLVPSLPGCFSASLLCCSFCPSLPLCLSPLSAKPSPLYASSEKLRSEHRYTAAWHQASEMSFRANSANSEWKHIGDSHPLTQIVTLHSSRCALRGKRKRVLYRAAPAPTGKRGAPRKYGERFQCGDPTTYGEAAGSWQGTDATGHPVEITWWTGLHLPKARHLEVTVIRVLRHRATDRPRDPRESWFL